MLRYLTFSSEQNQREENPLQAYALVGDDLLPLSFGPINYINILLGENNSGKSRFMREIMRNENSKIISDNGNINNIIISIGELYIKVSILKKPMNAIIKTYNTTHGSEFEKAFEKIFARKSDDRANEIKLNDYWSSLFDLSNQLRQNFDGTGNNFKSIIHSNDMIEEISKMIIIYEKIRNMFKEIASSKYTIRQVAGKLHDHQGHGFEFLPPFWTVDTYGRPIGLIGQAEDLMDQIGGVMSTLSAIQSEINTLASDVFVIPSRTYIPTLRTARTLIASNKARLESNNDIFSHTTQHDYDLVESGVIVNTGFGLYEAVDTTRNARHTGRTNFKAFEQFLSTTFFNGKTVEVVAERVKDERGGNILVAVAGVERDIHDLGDGIQAIIMLLYPLFIAPNEAWFFIEEPETHLHPGFQRLFVETITSNEVLRKKQLTIFLTTHSNHILDFALDGAKRINLFTFRRQEGKAGRSSFQIQLSAPRDLANLTALGVDNSSVFLANCTLWVEGITDRLYLRAYLQAYWAKLRTESKTVSLLEGLHYTFLEYAGANVEHYYFDELAPDGRITPDMLGKVQALSVANRIMLIADKDAGKDTRHEARTRQQHAGFVYLILPVREIENLLTPAVLVKTLQGLYKKQTFEATGLKQSSYVNTYIGKYLRNEFPALPDGFAPDKGSGTIGSSMKRRFAEEAIKHITWEVMSPAARVFTEEAHNFIMAHNPRLGSN